MCDKILFCCRVAVGQYMSCGVMLTGEAGALETGHFSEVNVLLQDYFSFMGTYHMGALMLAHPWGGWIQK